MRRSIVALAIAALLAVSPSPVAAGTYLQWYDRNGNGIADMWFVDDDGNTATAERILLDGNENGLVEGQALFGVNGWLSGLWLDAGEDGVYELLAQPAYHDNGALRGRLLWYDADVNGRFDVGYYDSDLDGYYEFVCVDTDYDGLADTWTGNAAPPGRTATDAIWRQLAANNAVTNLQAAGLSVFFPASAIPLGG